MGVERVYLLSSHVRGTAMRRSDPDLLVFWETYLPPGAHRPAALGLARPTLAGRCNRPHPAGVRQQVPAVLPAGRDEGGQTYL